MTRHILIDRRYRKTDYTIGLLYVDGVFFCNTLEDTDRGLTSSMSESQIRAKKVYGMTAIPAGTYNVTLTVSAKFSSRAWAKKYGGKVPSIDGVKGFSGVRIHPGTTASDTLGCVLVGKNSQKGRVTNSQYWYYKLMDTVIVPALKTGTVILEIKN